MWAHQGHFAGQGYHYPAFVQPPPFYFPRADAPLSPEEFARQQALARQQDLLRRRSSGLSEEQRSRVETDAHTDSPRSLKKSSSRSSRGDGAARPASSKPEVSTLATAADKVFPEEQNSNVPPPAATPGAKTSMLAKPGTDAIAQYVRIGQPASSISSGHQQDSNGLEDLDSELEDSGELQQARSPLSSLSGLPSWGSLSSAAREIDLEQTDSEQGATSEPHEPYSNLVGNEQHASISEPPHANPPIAAAMRSQNNSRPAEGIAQPFGPQAACDHSPDHSGEGRTLRPCK